MIGGGLPIAFVFNKKHEELVIQINNELAKMEEDGTLKTLMRNANMPAHDESDQETHSTAATDVAKNLTFSWQQGIEEEE